MHEPVLFQEVLDALHPRSGGRYIDGTAGGAGHARALLEASEPDGRLLALDADPRAVERVRERLAEFGERAVVRQANFVEMETIARQEGFDACDGILLDLGLSSYQLAEPDRGFSFQHDAPLDMRFSPDQAETAADLENHLSERELADLIYEYGEEPASRRIARAIVSRRPIATTGQLASIIEGALGRRGRIHPATRTFQALRIAVNDELHALRKVLPQAANLLRPGGRLAVISFHSLEDRIVKNFIRDHARGERPLLLALTKKPISPAEAEIERNPRSRSAKLRIAEKQ